VVLIHGLAGDCGAWKAQAEAMEKEFRVLAFDNRGAGRSSAPDYPYTTTHFAADTVGLMDAVGFREPAHIVGREGNRPLLPGLQDAVLRDDLGEPVGESREQLPQRRAVRPDADIGGVVEELVAFFWTGTHLAAVMKRSFLRRLQDLISSSRRLAADLLACRST